MVLEAIGALALACNILQAVEYGSKIILKAKTLHSSNRVATNQIDDLETITQQIKQLNKDLSNSVTSNFHVASPLQTRLTECNTESIRLSQKFVDFVQKLRPKQWESPNDPPWIESFLSAIRLKWHQEEIDVMQDGLSQAKSNLIIAFLLYMQ